MGYQGIKKLSLAAVSAVLLLLTVGCGKSGSGSVSGGGGAALNQWGYAQGYGIGAANCGNCGSAQSYVVTALGQAGAGYLQLGLDIFLDPRAMYSQDGSLMTVFQSYQGPIAGSGELEVMNDYSSCHIYPGVYRVQTAQPGQFLGMSQFRGMVLQGVHVQSGLPIVITLNASSNNYLSYLSSPSASWNGIPYNYKIQKTMTIVSAGNYQCSNGVYELY